LCQVSGLEYLFNDKDFSQAWESSDYIETNYELLTDDVSDVIDLYKIPLEDDKERIFHTYDKWECYKAGFYKSKLENLSHEECEEKFIEIMKNKKLFSNALNRVISEWKYSCEHYLTNKAMNRIAWLGQAAVCISSGVPSRYSTAWSKLNVEEQNTANKIANKYLNIWLDKNNLSKVNIEESLNINRQIELY